MNSYWYHYKLSSFFIHSDGSNIFACHKTQKGKIKNNLMRKTNARTKRLIWIHLLDHVSISSYNKNFLCTTRVEYLKLISQVGPPNDRFNLVSIILIESV